MDPKAMIDMNNLKVLNDYLNQTIDILSRQPRVGQNGQYGFSPFTPFHTTAAPMGTDTVYNPWFHQMGQQAQFGGFPGFGGMDPFFAQRAFGQGTYGQGTYGQGTFGQGTFGPMPFAPWQQSWGPMTETTRQAHLTQALAARQSVLEAMCRACGIPV